MIDESKLVVRQILTIVFVISAIVYACYLGLQITIEIMRPTPVPTDTPPPTFTPLPTATLPDTDFEAVVKNDSECRSGTEQAYEILANIPQYQPVMIIRKNYVGDWFLIRWKGSSVDCWIEAYLLSHDDDINLIPVIDTPPPPTSTPTPTQYTLDITPTRDRNSNGSSDSSKKTAQALTASAAQAQTSQALTASAAQAQTAQALTASAAQAQTAQAQVALTLTAMYCNNLSGPNLTVNVSSNGKTVYISWISVTGASSYQVKKSTDGNTFSDFGQETNGNFTTDLKQPNDVYYYKVVTKTSCGNKESGVKKAAR